ncbi:MAG: hypothetical protein HC845_12125 [Akkermansiaceae bacterium]|nr:hypothetical protein [Akkermansiaceae bacterium]
MIFRHISFITIITCLALAVDTAPAEESPAEVAKPSVTKIDETRYQIGEVVFDQKTREIRFPARVNMVEGLIEFLVVHQNGKVHEALLSTEISPTHLNLAFTLLRYPPSRELYPLPSATGGASGNYPEVPADIKAAARVNVELEWSENEKIKRLPANECIQHAVKTTAMSAGPWVYGGSNIDHGKFAAETTGDVIDIFTSPAAILNYPGDERSDDTVWIPFPKRIPAEGTPITVIITPFQNANLIPKP